ncbi:hypothetical protein GQR58_016855 [Nymphon striatum]|nr:hypothetical protein GQR58_016855 [Nymphon striatum]
MSIKWMESFYINRKVEKQRKLSSSSFSSEQVFDHVSVIYPSFITSWCNVADDSGIYLPMLDYTRSYQVIPLPNTILHMVGSGQPLKNLAGIFRYAASSNVCSNKDLNYQLGNQVRWPPYIHQATPMDLREDVQPDVCSIEGKRDRGRQRRVWGDDVKEWSRSASFGQAKRTAEKRERWCQIVANLRIGDGTA